MDNYIDWNNTSKAPNENVQDSRNSTSAAVSSTEWQNDKGDTAGSLQNPYNVDPVHKPYPQVRSASEYAQRAYRTTLPHASISPVQNSASSSNGQQHMYAQMLSQRPAQGQSFTNVGNPTAGSTVPKHSPTHAVYGAQPGYAYTNPYSYANSANPYNAPPQGHTGQPHANFSTMYNNQPPQPSSTESMSGRYPAQGHFAYPQAAGVMPQHSQYYQQYSNGMQAAYQTPPYYTQYQTNEDALNRVHQSWTPNQNNAAGGHVNAQQLSWQNMPSQPVYFGMDARPVQQNRPLAAPARVVPPASPPRPKDPLAALRYDVSHCLNDYNTSRDLKGCSAALLAIMATCDPVMPPAETPSGMNKNNAAPEKLSTPATKDSELDPKIKQIALLSVVHSEIKGAMVEEVTKNKSIRAKLRTWFVRAHKDNSYVVLKALVSVLNKLTSLSAQSLAEVKFGKAILIVSRKCEDKEVKDLLSSWTSKAEESLVVERELDAAAAAQSAATEGESKRTVKLVTGDSTKSARSTASKPQEGAKKVESKTKEAGPKKAEGVAKTNAAFFKKDTLPTVKPVVAKPGMAAALAGIKARKRGENDKITTETTSRTTATADNANTTTMPKVTPVSKPSFSALKLVEGLKRTASPLTGKEVEPAAKKQKQKKRVTWRPDLELEQVLIFESIEPEGGWEMAHTPHEYGNARDLDRKEGAILHRGLLHDREEDFIDWGIPTALDFSHKSIATASDTRGPKTAGTKKIYSKACEDSEDRESNVFLVAYASEGEIPWSPSETLAVSDLQRQISVSPKNIPLPQELRSDWRIRQVVGDAIEQPQKSVYEPIAAAFPAPIPAMPTTIPVSAQLDIGAILAGIAAAQQKAGTTTAIPDPTATVAGTPGPLPENSDRAVPENGSSNPASLSAAMPPLPIVDAQMADFLRMASAGNNNFGGIPPPLPPSLVPPGETEAYDTRNSQPLPPQFGGLKDVRPWVKFNENGRYREPCRFIAQGKCEKGENCGYLHLEGMIERKY